MTLAASTISLSSHLDQLAYSALNDRIKYLEETKPEVIFRNVSAPLDAFGFYREANPRSIQVQAYFPASKEKSASSGQETRSEIARIKAFSRLLLNGPEHRRKELKLLVRKGISEEHRGTVWKLCLQAGRYYKPAEYSEQLSYQQLLEKEISQRVVDQINRDIDRTMPQLAFFTNSDQLRSLFCVLKAYAVKNPQVGYCYGMGFIAAVFLYYLPEVDAFECFSLYMAGHSDLYSLGMVGTRRKCALIYEILRKTDREIFAHLYAVGLDPNMLASWVMTLFFYSLDFHIAIRLFDMFICEGDKALVRAAIALLRRAAQGRRYKRYVLTTINGPEHQAQFQEWAAAVKSRAGISIIGMPHDDVYMKISYIGFALKNADGFVKEMLQVHFTTQEMCDAYARICSTIQ